MHPLFPTRRSSEFWEKFVQKHRAAYALSPAAQALLAEKPRRQIVGDPDHGFEDVPFSPNTADLDKVVAYANTVRNNLFHGGKRSEEHTSELQSLMRISYAVFCLKKTNNT